MMEDQVTKQRPYVTVWSETSKPFSNEILVTEMSPYLRYRIQQEFLSSINITNERKCEERNTKQ